MNLVFDLGNTNRKYAVFDNRQLIHLHNTGSFGVDEISAVQERYSVTASIISSVTAPDTALSELLKGNTMHIDLSAETPIPIINKYATPATLGNDRLAAAVGANDLYRNKNILIIDAGTCIKYEFVDEQNVYHGGAISPGLTMRLQAMHNFTARLPLIDPASIGLNTPPELTGNSTTTSMVSGTYNGALLEVEGMIDRYLEAHKNLTVVITGGDSRFFELHIKRQIFALPNLVLEGLNRILNFNLNQN